MGLRVRLKASVNISRPAAAGAHRRAGAEDLRDDPGRQRVELVPERRAEPEVVERPATRARASDRCRLRGRRHLPPAAVTQPRTSSRRRCSRRAPRRPSRARAGARSRARARCRRVGPCRSCRRGRSARTRAADRRAGSPGRCRRRAAFPPDRRSTVTDPPAGVSRSAFSTRFDATCSTRSASASTHVSSPCATQGDAELPRSALVPATASRASPRGRPARDAPRTPSGSSGRGRAGRARAVRAGWPRA